MESSSSASAGAAASSSCPSNDQQLPAAGPPKTFVPGVDDDTKPQEDEVQVERPKANPRLSAAEEKALRADDFLLGRDRIESNAKPEQAHGEKLAVEETLQQLDVAVRSSDFRGAEALWKRVVSIGTLSVLERRGDLRPIAMRYVSTMRGRIMDDLETAIDRKDVTAAEKQHQRLCDLRDTCKGSRLVETPSDIHGRSVELEARYQQLCHKSGPLMCSLFPRVQLQTCMGQAGQPECVLL